MLYSFELEKIKNLFKLKRGLKKGEVEPLEEDEKVKLSSETEKLFLELHKGTIKRLREAVQNYGLLDEYSSVTRDLLPEDLGDGELKTWKVKTKKNGWNIVFEKATENYSHIAIEGFMVPKNCPVTQIRIVIGNTVKEYWHIEGREGLIFIDKPFITGPNQKIRIDFFALETKEVILPFFGTVIERRGMLVA